MAGVSNSNGPCDADGLRDPGLASPAPDRPASSPSAGIPGEGRGEGSASEEIDLNQNKGPLPTLSRSTGRGLDAVECRPVVRGEIEAGLRLILATDARLAGDAQVLDFLSFCVERKIDTNAMWLAIDRGRIVWAMLPVTAPGRTMLLFTPTVQFVQTPPQAIALLAASIGQHYRQRGVQLAQILIDPNQRSVVNAYLGAGFEELAELVYLQKSLRRRPASLPALPPGFSLQTYSRQTHADFARIIQASYEQSMDCPALNGMRDMKDVIAGHQATGEFDPSLWWILCEQEQPIAVLLLTRLPQGASMELVYLGLSVAARGRGIGDLLMNHAIATATSEGRENLSLAVDSRNQPALRLYYRHGMRRIGSRTALLMNLSKGSEANVQQKASDFIFPEP
jgi:mycothiol synthase